MTKNKNKIKIRKKYIKNIRKGENIKFNWKVYEYDYQKRTRNLTSEAQGVVKSSKHFPVFQEEGQDYVFKPLSKTKPFSTPYFAYSEVYWSTIINKYFDEKAPIYRLAICKNIEDEKKYHHGTIVKSLEEDNKKLINLYEWFRDHPDPNIDIKEYINYCEMYYDYRMFFDTQIMKDNPEIAKEFATQILLSILRLDQNYHYENILFHEQEGKLIDVASPIDHEFSTMFLYPDNEIKHQRRFKSALSSITISPDDPTNVFSTLEYEAFGTLAKNIERIANQYPEKATEFLEKLKVFIRDLKKEPITLENHGYLVPFNSNNFQIGQALYKQNDSATAKRIQENLAQYNPSIEQISQTVYHETLLSSRVLEKKLEKSLIKKY